MAVAPESRNTLDDNIEGPVIHHFLPGFRHISFLRAWQVNLGLLFVNG